MISLIMITYQVVDSFDKRSKCLAIVFLFKEEVLFGKDLHQVHEAIAAFFAERLGVWSQIGEDGDDALVDWLEKSGAVFYQAVD